MRAHHYEYGPLHQQRRKMFRIVMRFEILDCAFCGLPIKPGDPWDLGHTKDRTQSFPEHQWCNRATAKRRLTHSRTW